jgi:para-nitrobenzyl esterase
MGGISAMKQKFSDLFKTYKFTTSIMALILSLAVFAGCWDLKALSFLALLNHDLTVSTESGYVRGTTTDDAWVWRGIPYAKPPVGDLRWKAPVDPDPWNGIRDATAPCSECPQQVTDKFWRPAPGQFTGSEDCLYLDVYHPKTLEKGLPVFVWIHGGANIIGSAQLYNGSVLAKQGDMIVVVVQYRLGMLGWLTHPSLRHGTADDNSGNYGDLDIMKALAWVQKNIKAFGGDPDRVTVGGQSAGGHHVMNLIISPKTNNFKRAFAESPALAGLMPLRTQAAGDAQTNAIIDRLLISDGLAADIPSAEAYRAGRSDADTVAYLRGKTPMQIMQAATATSPTGSMPVPTSFMDGTVLPTTDWLTAISNGNFKRVPLIIGTAKYEFKDLMTLYARLLALFGVPSSAPTYTWDDLYEVINETGTPTLSQVLPTPVDQFVYEATGLMKSREWQSECNTIARAIKAVNPATTVYSYLFSWTGGGDPALADFSFIFGASHAQDVPFFFGDTTDLFKGYSFTAANHDGRVALQKAMINYLGSFIKTGNTNASCSQLPEWTQWSNEAADPKFITFDADLDNYILTMDAAEATPEIIAAERAAYLNIGGPGLAALWAALGI